MFIPLIVIGTSADGPEGIPFQPETMSEAENVFGWWNKEYQILSSVQSSAQTTYPVWGNQVEAYKKIGTKLYENSLYMLQSSGTYLTFGSPGVSGTYLFKYIKTPDFDNLVSAAKAIVDQGADLPYFYRVPGTKSTCQIGDLTLESEYSGEIYNNITITVTGGYLSINYTPEYSTSGSSYALNIPSNLLIAKINNDHYCNKHPLLAYSSTLTPSIPVGTYLTTGGAAGQITESTVLDAIASFDLNNVAIILLAGCPSSGIVSSALNYLTDLGDDSGITCLVSSLPAEFISSDSSTIEAFLSSLPFDSNKLFYVPGWATITSSVVNPTWIPLSHVFAGLWNAYSSSPTNKATSIDSITPLWSTEQLHSLGENFCVFNKFIINGLSPWRSNPTNGENPLLNKVRFDIAERMHGALDYIIGEPAIPSNTIYEIISNALQNLDNVKDSSYTCEVGTDYIIVDIYVTVYGETQNIQISLTSKRPDNS